MPDDYVSPREFGALEQQVQNLDDRVGKLEGKIEVLSGHIAELVALANKGKGAWWAGMTAASLLSGVAAYLTTLFFNR